MSSENKSLVLFEDNETSIKLAQMVANEIGWAIIAVARTVDEAQRLIPQLQEMDIEYALVDGNLSAGEYEGYEGLAITRAIHEQAKKVKVIGFSSVSPQEEVDIQMSKGSSWRKKLISILTS